MCSPIEMLLFPYTKFILRSTFGLISSLSNVLSIHMTIHSTTVLKLCLFKTFKYMRLVHQHHSSFSELSRHCGYLNLYFHLSSSYSKAHLQEAPPSCCLWMSPVIAFFTLYWDLFSFLSFSLDCELHADKRMYPWVIYLKTKTQNRPPQLPHL